MMRITVFLTIVCLAALASAPGVSRGADEEGFVYNDKGRRDPFMPLITRHVKVATGLDTVQAVDDILLEGIVWDSGGESIAIMNGIIVREGERYGVLSIDKIHETSVEIFIDNIRHELNLTEEEEG
jgi:hypothetical protein